MISGQAVGRATASRLQREKGTSQRAHDRLRSAPQGAPDMARRREALSVGSFGGGAVMGAHCSKNAASPRRTKPPGPNNSPNVADGAGLYDTHRLLTNA